MLTNPGTVPADFRNTARKQIERYNTSTIIDTTIASIRHAKNNTFEATDISGKKYTARKVVLGTGLRDVLPSTPGLDQAWGKGVYWCPWCDGYEHRDQPFGILGGFQDIIGSVLEVYSTLNKDIIAFPNGTQTPDQEAILQQNHPDWKAIVKAYNIRLDNRTITSIERIQDGEKHKDNEGRQFDIFRLHFTEGDPVERNAFITNFPTEQRSSLPADMGLKLLGGKIDSQTNAGLRTSMPGVWAVGDANSDNSTNVPHAMYSGKRAAVYSHGKLLLSRCFAVAATGRGWGCMLMFLQLRCRVRKPMLLSPNECPSAALWRRKLSVVWVMRSRTCTTRCVVGVRFNPDA